MSLLTTLLATSSGGGSPGVILAPTLAASTTNLLATYANGTAGVGATLTNSSSQLTAARVASTAALTVTYSNGALGVGATLTNNGAQAAISIDSVALSVNDRVLIKDQAAPAQNGVYSVTTVGTGATNWVLTRVTDFDQAAEMIAGTQISITAGTTNTGTKWILSATITTVGTDAVTFAATAAITLDGISPTAGQRVLIKNQTSALQNGVYTVTTVGSATTDWVLTRSTDFDEPPQITVGVIVEVVSGTINAGTLWQQTATVTTIGTDSIVFAALSPGGLTASRAVVTDANGKLASATTTATEIGYVNGVTSAIQTQLNTLTTNVQSGSEIYAADGGATDSYAITLTPALGAYVVGMVINFKANTVNTGTASLNVNALGAITILKAHDQTLVTGDIEAGQFVTVIYDGTNFQMQSQIGANQTASKAVVTDAAGSFTTSATSSTEIGFVAGVTSAIQTQLNTKLAIGAVDQTTTPVTMVVDTTYVANNAGLVTLNVPATVAQGSIFQIVGQGAGGWLVRMNTGQTANASGGSTTSAGSLASTNRYDCVRLLCTVANTTFTVVNSSGVITNA